MNTWFLARKPNSKYLITWLKRMIWKRDNKIAWGHSNLCASISFSSCFSHWDTYFFIFLCYFTCIQCYGGPKVKDGMNTSSFQSPSSNKDLRNSERLLDLKNTNLENLWLWTSFVTHGKKHLNDNLKMSLEPVCSCVQKCDCGVPFLFTVPWPPVQEDKRAETMTKRLTCPVNTVEMTFQEMT